MKFFCDQCNAQYMIADEKVGPRGVKVKCKKCSHVIVVKAADAAAAAPISTAGDETRIHDGTGIQAALAAERKTSGESDIATATSDAPSIAETSSPASHARAPDMSGKTSVKEWFVAVGDAQLGPLDVAEVHGRWDAGDLHEDSLAWRAGMPDWIALSEIPEFTDWVTQRPRTSPDKAEAVAKRGEGLGLAPASGVAWKPSAASALSSLMQEELLAAAAPKPAPVVDKPAGMPDLGNVAKLGENDLFGAAPSPSAQAPVASRDDGASGGGAAWSVPAPRKTGLSPAVWALIGGGVLSVVGLGVFVTRNQAPAAPVPMAQAPAQPSNAAAQAPAQVLSSTPQPQPQPQAQAPQGAAAVAAPAPAPAAPAPSPAAAAPTPNPQHAAAPGPEAHAAVHPKKVHETHALRAAAPAAAATGGAPAPQAAVKASLGKEDIWGVVRQSASKVAPCLKNARSRNEIPAGKYTFVLDWTIRPDGAVVDAHLKGPPEVLSTSLAACFSSAMMTWHFPASQAGAPIANFPFGPVNVP